MFQLQYALDLGLGKSNYICLKIMTVMVELKFDIFGVCCSTHPRMVFRAVDISVNSEGKLGREIKDRLQITTIYR